MSGIRPDHPAPIQHADGVVLAAFVRELGVRHRRLDPEMAAWIVHQVLSALAIAHEHEVVHGAVTATKVRLGVRGGIEVVGFGGPRSGAEEREPWRDAASSAFLLAELVTGRRSLVEIENCLDTVEPALAALVRRGLDISRKRPWDCASFRDALGVWLRGRDGQLGAPAVASLVAEHRGGADKPALRLGLGIDAMPPLERATAPRRDASALMEPTQLASFESCGDLAGDLSDVPALSVLFRFIVTRATGAAVFSFGGLKREVYFRDGRVDATVSNVASEQLGHHLVACGTLANRDLARVVAELCNVGGSLELALDKLGLVEPRVVREHAYDLARARVVDVCRWHKGRYTWYEGREAAHSTCGLDGDPLAAVGIAALGIDESVVTTAERRARVLRPAMPPRVDPIRFAIEGLDDLLVRVDGKHVNEALAIGYKGKDQRLRCFRMLYLLELCELAIRAR